VTVAGWLKELDDDALAGRLSRRFAHPAVSSWQAWWAVAGLCYGLAVGTWWVASLVTFWGEDPTLLLGLAVGLPWPALPLAWLLRFGRPRASGAAAAVLALAHFTLLLGSWGVEALYVPLVVVGLMVAAAPGRLPRATTSTQL
jgi:hypothetical protein